MTGTLTPPIPEDAAGVRIFFFGSGAASLPAEFESFFRDGVPLRRRDRSPAEMEVYGLYLGLRALELRTCEDHSALRRRILDAVVSRVRSADGLPEHRPPSPHVGGGVQLRFTSAATRLLIEGVREGLIEDHALVWRLLGSHLAHRDELTGGARWFLHDSFEQPGSRYPHRLVANTAWGSSPTNTLTLNTHLDTLNTLLYARRFMSPPSDAVWDELDGHIRAGLAAVELALRRSGGAARSFDFLDGWMRGQLFAGQGGGGVRRGVGGVVRRAYFPLRHRLKPSMRLLRFRDGYLERDLGLRGEGFRYHMVNAWDIAKLAWQLEKAKVGTEFVPDLRAATLAGLEYAFASPYRYYLAKSVRNQVAGAQLCEALMTWFARGDLLTERWVERYVAVRGQLPPSPALMGYDPAVTDGFDANGAVRRVARAAAGFDMDVLPCRDGCLVINCTGVTAEVDLEEHAPRLERGIGSVTKSGAGIALGPGAAAVLGNG